MKFINSESTLGTYRDAYLIKECYQAPQDISNTLSVIPLPYITLKYSYSVRKALVLAT